MLMSTATLRPIRVELEPLVLTGSAVDETDYVARFTGGSTDWTQTATLPTATIRWGDGTVQKEHVSVSGQNASTLQVLPFVAHPYTKPGTYTIHVTLREGSKAVATSATRLRVSTVSSDGRILHAAVGKPFSGTLGTFTTQTPLYTDPSSVSFAYSTIIEWGDGNSTSLDPPSAGAKQIAPNRLQVTGSHTYEKRGNYVVQVVTWFYRTALGAKEGIEMPDVSHTDLVSRIIVG